MNVLRLVLGACVVLALAGVSVSGDNPKSPTKDEKKDAKKDKNDFKEKILGTFEVMDENSIDKGTLVTFLKGGKITMKGKGKKDKADFTYKIDGDKLTISYGKTASPAYTIEKITDDELLMKNVAGAEVKWKRK
jgi:uncharacterized protein (TIGR03066 family)